ncbi:MAG: hypothetical protein KCHDKBKB_02999 [Elusimicrobia bacterium]|nr:hypothetical protein [Elusimicrobiota bacterium]
MNRTLEASMRLEISQLQAQLAAADGEIKKFQERLSSGSRRNAGEVSHLTAAYHKLVAEQERAKAVNPWTTASAGAKTYARTIEQQVIPVLQRQSSIIRGSGVQTGNEALLAQWRAQSGSMGGMARGGGGRLAIGNAAMQLQDVIVQAQMGTRASIIVAQQGSQLLGAFGASGAILGAVVALGGAFALMGEKGAEGFRAVADSAKNASQQITAAAGSVEQLTQLYGDFAAKIQSAGAFAGPGMSLGRLATSVMMGVSERELQIAASNAQMTLQLRQMDIEEQLVDASAKALEIAELRAAGETEKADAMQRQLDLAKQINAINATNLPAEVKAQLAADAGTMSALRPRELAGKKADEIAARMREQEIAAMGPQERYMALSEQQDAIFARMQREGGMFYEPSVAGLGQWAAGAEKFGMQDVRLKALQMQEEAANLQKQMDDAVAQQRADVKAADEKRDAEKEAAKRAGDEFMKPIQAEQERKRLAREELAKEIQYAQMRRDGRGEQVEMLKQAERIHKETGVSADEALMLAQNLQDMQRATSFTASTAAVDDGKIHGYSQGQAWKGATLSAAAGRSRGALGGGSRRGFGGLNDWHALQSGASEWEMLQRGPSAWSSLQAGFNQSDFGLAGRKAMAVGASRAAAAQDNSEKRDTSNQNLFQKMLEVLQKGLLE